MTDIAILGCGPVGLMSALACVQAGHIPYIYSLKEKSDIPGSQHLHGAIPDLTSRYPDNTTQYIRIGTAAGYALKVYGDAARNTGWDSYWQVYPSWNMRRAYDALWDRFEATVVPGYLGYERVREITLGHDIVISTLPAQQLCHDKTHVFQGVPYFLQQLPTPPGDLGREIFVYNGIIGDPWYRWSILGDQCAMEYMKPPPNDQPYVHGLKAVSSNCHCWPTVHRAGRWAEWKHGVTVYTSYQKVVQLMKQI